MEIIKNIKDLNKAIKDFKNFGFVPTMGGIHKGHISLIIKSQKKCKKTIVSLFVNPTQFNERKDFDNYPRNFKKDLKILNIHNVDYVFMPTAKTIYKTKNRKFKILKKDKILCAVFRKGHFEGVLNVMDRLLSIIKSKNVFMGEKDYQQIFLIKKYLSKKHKTKIINCKTIRDKNKVALSTRNYLLTKKNYSKVSLISKFLLKLRRNKKKSINFNETIKYLEKNYKIKIEYLEFRNENNLLLSDFRKKYRLFVAYKIGKIRLIDNF